MMFARKQIVPGVLSKDDLLKIRSLTDKSYNHEVIALKIDRYNQTKRKFTEEDLEKARLEFIRVQSESPEPT